MNIGGCILPQHGSRGEGVGVAGEGLVAGDEIQAGSGRREQGMLCAYGTRGQVTSHPGLLRGCQDREGQRSQPCILVRGPVDKGSLIDTAVTS